MSLDDALRANDRELEAWADRVQKAVHNNARANFEILRQALDDLADGLTASVVAVSDSVADIGQGVIDHELHENPHPQYVVPFKTYWKMA